jgi:hypothetical protein
LIFIAVNYPYMKKSLFFIFISCSFFLNAQLNPAITSWIQNPDTFLTANRGYDNIPSNCILIQYSTTDVYVSCFCIPGYSIGPWSNPNVAENQNFVYKITLNPVPYTGTPTAIGLGHIGVLTNGVSIFNANDAQFVNNVWSRNGYYFEYPSFDNCLGHAQQQGEYHHHVSPKCLYDQADSTHHAPLIGYMFDGYPVYGAYGYADTATTGGAVKRVRSSYRLRADQSRTTDPYGDTASTAGPAVGTQYPMGCLLWDWEYVAGLGDLDSANGRWCRTPEYPDGTYAYFMTLDDTLAPAYPYTSAGYYHGVVQAGNVGGGPGTTGGHNTITVPTTVYTDTTATGISTIAQQIAFELVPNPTQAYVYIYMGNSSTNNATGKLYDDAGHMLKDLGYMQPTIAYSIDLTIYPAGVYLLHVSDGKQDVVRKIVKD